MTASSVLLVETGGLSAEALRARLERAGLRVTAAVASPDDATPDLMVAGAPRDAADGADPRPTVEAAGARHALERRLRECEERYAAVLAACPDAVLVTGADGRILALNGAAEALTGWPRADAVGRPLEHVFCTAGGLPPRDGATYPATLLARDGPGTAVEVSVTPVRGARAEAPGAVLVGRAAVDRRRTEEALRRAEEQLQQAQKLEAVGRLAGGVAHDVNNMMTIVMGYGEEILDELRADDPVRGMVEEMRRAGERSATITRQLLAFTRKQAPAPTLLNLNRIVAGTEKMLRRLIGEDVQLVTVPGAELGAVNADPGQVEQVLLNLALNARDAMPQGGWLTIETRNLRLDEAHARAAPEVRPGDYVMLAVSDTGVGMDEVTRARLFEPFFTTKEAGKGTGLGLATVYSVVKQSGGHIYVSSEPDQGTTFKIYFPRATGAAEHWGPATPAAAPRGTETVLLAEDDNGVRGLTSAVLRQAGYTVLEAADGIEALAVARDAGGTIHLLLTDAIMPLMSGRVLADELTRVRPEVKVLFMSGYTEDSILRHGLLAGEVAFLQKPFTTHSLARKVREVLDAPARAWSAAVAG